MLLEKLFALKENGTSLRREFVAGLTNFMTISYIIFVQPSMLSLSGMDYGAVMVATCLSSALATFSWHILRIILLYWLRVWVLTPISFLIFA